MKKYNPKNIERKWQKIWQKAKIANVDLKKAKKPFYNLMMFPYPSGEGLHIGHAYTYSGADAYGRFKKMQGYDVFEPMGFDAFGIHAENYAIKINKHPKKLVQDTIKNFRKQMNRLGIMFDWEKEINTTQPKYYKWTQWIFLQLFKHGLAYIKEAPVNWCPSCKTVLADEQVIGGKCERCSFTVIERQLKQWFLKITQYADKLDNNLASIDWSNKVKILQKNWIGRSEGATINFYLPSLKKDLEVFTSRPDTLFGATFIALSAKHKLADALIVQEKKSEFKKILQKISKVPKDDFQKEKIGFFTGSFAINPINKEKVPIWIANYVLENYGFGAIMGVPSHDARDFDFAKKYKIEIRKVVVKEISSQDFKDDFYYEGEGYLKDSGYFSKMTTQEGAKAILTWLKRNKNGKKTVTYKMRDWLISRQRYWGPPIPIIYCRKCFERVENNKLKVKRFIEGVHFTSIDDVKYAIVPAPEKDLPVKLPFVENFRPSGTGKSPLASIESFVNTTCPNCGFQALRETDVMDNFLDSSWYYLAYIALDKKRKMNSKMFSFDKKLLKKWLPVNMYIGGAEHSVLHLLYTRFIMMALKDMGYIHFDEPFKKFRAHGLITKDGAKMSKSKGNVVNPMKFIEQFGADAVRMYLLFIGPFDQGGDFSDNAISGVVRFLHRLWKIAHSNLLSTSKEMKILNGQTIKKVTQYYESLKFNVIISELMRFLNEIERHPNKESLLILIKLLAPICPHISEELFQFLTSNTYAFKSSIHQNDRNFNIKQYKSIFQEKWPQFNQEEIQEEIATIVIQINGKFKDKVEIPINLDKDRIQQIALTLPKIKSSITDKQNIKRVIFVPNKIINFVI